MTRKGLSHTAKPFVKWAGGKGQLLPQLDRLLPEALNRREFTYIEPFVGGGAMLFHMLQKFPKIRRVVINDINPHLVTYNNKNNLLIYEEDNPRTAGN